MKVLVHTALDVDHKLAFDSTSNRLNDYEKIIDESELDKSGEPVKKYGLECAKIFHNKTTVVYLEVGDVITTNWTILRELN